MSEFERLDDDRDLAAFEQILRAVPLPLPAPERDRLLYACGFATARQFSMRRLRASAATAAALGILTGGLTATVWTNRLDAPSVRSAQSPQATRENPPGDPAAGLRDNPLDTAIDPPVTVAATRRESQVLTAGMSLDEALRLLERDPHPVESRAHSHEPPAPPLRPYSRFTP